MATIKINVERCKGCGLCVAACPRDNIRLSEDLNEAGHSYAVIADLANCTFCAMCGRMCPDLAIEIDDPKEKKN